MMQRFFANDRLNAGLSARPSARALIIRSPIDGSFAHDGTSPHRTRDSTRCSSR